MFHHKKSHLLSETEVSSHEQDAERQSEAYPPEQEEGEPFLEHSPESLHIATLETELASAKAKYTEIHERMLRIAAEADNARKRFEKEKIDTRLYSIQEFAKDLLPVIDAFDKAMAAIEQSAISLESEEGKKVGAIVEGVQLVSKAFYEAVKKHGVERLPGKGEPFNPKFHNAIAKVVDSSLTVETVIDEYMPGYKIGDRVLRTALVRVGASE